MRGGDIEHSDLLHTFGMVERVGMRKTEATNAVFRGEQCVEYVYAVLRNDG